MRPAARLNRLFVFFILFVLVGLLPFGCVNPIEQHIEDIHFELVTLDEAGTPTVVFSQGSEITFALNLTNNSPLEVEVTTTDGCALIQSPEFMIVYHSENSETADIIAIGSPYARPVQCPAINMVAHRVQPGETSEVTKASWSQNTENQPLPAGEYLIRAEFDFNLKDQKRLWVLEKPFTVE